MKTGVAEAAPAFYIRRVKTRLASGQYQMEPVSCFCGSNRSQPVVDKDRYGFDYRMVMCLDCGILYANPRMTEESFKKFYNDEYRKIYDYGSDEDALFKNSVKNGIMFHEFIEHHDIKTDVVFDIGCNAGGWLVPFKEKGNEIYGCDYSQDRTEFGRTHGLNLMTGGLETLEVIGKKANFIIVNHVLEHQTDIPAFLKRVDSLLEDDGFLFIGVPGLFAYNRNVLFQNAHTYQFTAGTLAYVMKCCGFDEFYLDEFIASLWKKSESFQSIEDRPRYEAAKVFNYLFEEKKKVPIIKTICKFSVGERKENILKSLRVGVPDIDSLKNTQTGGAVVIGGGPSVDGMVQTIKGLVHKGNRVVAIERMYGWCLENGIVPDYVVVLDASEDVHESFNKIHPSTKHLVASQCQSSILDRLKGSGTFLFHTPQNGFNLDDLWKDSPYENITVINAGGSVTLGAVSISFFLGFRDIHLFGFDCHVTSGDYAKGITGVGDIRSVYEIEIDGRVFKTTSPFISFAQQFFILWGFAKERNMVDSIKIYGDSMACAMSREDIQGHAE